LVHRDAAGRLKAMRSSRSATASRTIVWHLGDPGSTTVPFLEAVSEGLCLALAEHEDLMVAVVGDIGSAPAMILNHPRLAAAEPELSDDNIIDAPALIWTPDPEVTDLDGNFAPLVMASYVGAMPIVAADNPASAHGYTDPDNEVVEPDDPMAWAKAIASSLPGGDPPTGRKDRSALERRQIQRIEALLGGRASLMLTNRFVGWASSAGVRR
jgi:hypothetical protein